MKYQLGLLVEILAHILRDKIFLLTTALTTIIGSGMVIAGAAYDAVIGVAGMVLYVGLRESLSHCRSRDK